MTAKYVRDRITRLRLQKGVSEYKMSYDLGHSRGYINNISSGKALPSLAELFAICDYFEISVVEFFNEKVEDPRLMQETVNGMGEIIRRRSGADSTVDRSAVTEIDRTPYITEIVQARTRTAFRSRRCSKTTGNNRFSFKKSAYFSQICLIFRDEYCIIKDGNIFSKGET